MADRPDLLAKLESRWALVQQFGAIPVIGAVAGGAFAWLSDFMAQWAPYSWFVGALVGAILLQALNLLFAWKGERDERKRRIALLAVPKGQINPLDDIFQHRRIYLSDLLPPLGSIIEGKTFRNCEIIGPANIILGGTREGSGEMNRCGYYQADGVITNRETIVNNGILLRDCSFRDCNFYKVTLLMPLIAYKLFYEELKGLNWLNDELVPKDESPVPQ